MKHVAGTIIAFAGVSNALPHPQFNLPSFSLPSFSLPTGLPGSGSGLPGLPELPAGLPTGLPGLGSGSGSGSGSGLGGLLGGLPNGGGKLPTLPLPTGGSGLGSGFDLGSLIGGGSGKLPSLPTTKDKGSTGKGFDWGSLIGGGSGLGSGLGGGLGQSTDVVPSATPTNTDAIAAPTNTGSTGGSGSVGSNCTPQGNGGGSSENGVTAKNCCTDMTVIFARGTGEMGNVGIVSGPPMFKALRSKLGNGRVTVQGVDYPASAGGNANLGADGGKKMADLVAAALSQCPNTKIVVSGYSQGGMVVHNAFSNGLSASKVAGAVLFGDPLKTQKIGDLPANKIKQFCGTSDTICGGGGDGGATGSHISYGSSADAAASFAIQAAGLA